MSTPLHTLAKVPSGGVLEAALADSLAGVPLNDVTFYACTRRAASGKVDKPRAVHANSGILKAASAYFRGLLSAPASPDVSQSTDQYDYECNSDLEDEDDEIEELDGLLATPSEAYKDGSKKKQPGDASPEGKSTAVDLVGNTAKVVHLDSVAADTLEAVIFYIYTGNIYFLPLRSRGPKVREEAQAADSAAHPRRPMCSCKSVYRFAEEVGLHELRALAEAHLFAELKEENILEELFSKFSTRYPDILRRQVDVLLESHWTPATRAAMGPMMARVVRGEMPHAAPALTLLLDRISATPPPATSASPNIQGGVMPSAPVSLFGASPPPSAKGAFGHAGATGVSREVRSTTPVEHRCAFSFGPSPGTAPSNEERLQAGAGAGAEPQSKANGATRVYTGFGSCRSTPASASASPTQAATFSFGFGSTPSSGSRTTPPLFGFARRTSTPEVPVPVKSGTRTASDGKSAKGSHVFG